MTNIFFSILLAAIFSSYANQDKYPNIDISSNNDQTKNMDFDMDTLDVYKLKIGKTFLYSNYESFISNMGIPNKMTITKTNYDISSKADLDKVISTAKDPDIVTLHYPGIDMWYDYDNYIIPSTIDFRKTDKSVTYGLTIFDRTYSIEQFKKEFPKSANLSFTLPQSLFEIETQEKSTNYKHYMVVRKSKDDPNAMPMIEFTFNNGKLIFILFANFG